MSKWFISAFEKSLILLLVSTMPEVKAGPNERYFVKNTKEPLPCISESPKFCKRCAVECSKSRQINCLRFQYFENTKMCNMFENRDPLATARISDTSCVAYIKRGNNLFICKSISVNMF